MSEAGSRLMRPTRASVAGCLRHRQPHVVVGLVALVIALGPVGCARPTSSSRAIPASLIPTVTVAATMTSTPAPSPEIAPRFVAIGSMDDQRTQATATLLLSGKVLIAGGDDDIGLPTRTAELYDPTTGKFAPTGSMKTARAGQTATLLADGRVLLAGGSEYCQMGTRCQPPLASAELYDPATGKFSSTGPMTTGLTGGAAVRLQDGRVLVLNGIGQSATSELYDPASGRFSRTGDSLTVAPEPGEAPIVLPGTGKVFGAGLGGAELYDPTSGRFTVIPIPPPPGEATAPNCGGLNDCLSPQTATLLKDGRVLLYEYGYLQLYDPATGAFTSAGTLGTPGVWAVPQATLLADGRVLFTGGWTVPTTYSEAASLAAIYDPATGSARMIGAMTVAREDQTATLLPDGDVLIAGGQDEGGVPFASAELFVP